MKIDFINLPLRVNNYSDSVKKKFNEIFKNSDFILGKSLNEFEKKISKFTQSKYAIGVNSGYDALFLSLKCLGVKIGDEVITVSNTYVATVNAIVNTGAKPILIDVNDDHNIDVSKIEKRITKKTKAIICVHLTGNPCEMDKILKIAKNNNIKIIEDCAQAIGAKFKKKHVGNFGEFGCFSLHPAKNLHVLGDGGFIITNKKKHYEKLIKLRNHGHTSRELIDSFGFNSRLDSLQAAYANIMLEDYNNWQEKINRIAKLYNEKVINIVTKPIVKSNTKHVYHNYILTTRFRNKLKNYLKKNGIETRIHYPLAIHQQKIFIKTFGKINLPNTERLSKQIISLPIYPELNIKNVKFIIKVINNFFNYKLKNKVT